MTAATLKRIAKDWKQLEAEPVAMANARPCDTSDMTLWDGVIGVKLMSGTTPTTVPLHFLIDFPKDYPSSAPSIGFSVPFPYSQGASYTKQDGRLKGKFVVCLDLLGNFDHVHTEWKNNVGSGWSPAYSVTTLLVNLVALLSDLNEDLCPQQRKELHAKTMAFLKTNSHRVPAVLTEDELRKNRLRRKATAILEEFAAPVRSQLLEFAGKAKFDNDVELMEEFMVLCQTIKKRQKTEHAKLDDPVEMKVNAVDPNIVCFASGASYTTNTLGFGVSVRQQGRNTQLGTAGELLSEESFAGGLRQDTTKAQFQYFLPAFINPAHACNNTGWVQLVNSSVLQIGKECYNAQNLAEAVVQVFPRLINTMVVDIMKPDVAKTAALAMFEALCSFWRTFYWYISTNKAVANSVSRTIRNFTSNESFRHKNTTPDVGAVLACFTACPSGIATIEDFARAYIDENSVRNVMWWQRSGTAPEPVPVFAATQVSRHIAMFQFLVLRTVVGGNQAETAATLDATNGKAPQKLETLLREWKQLSASTTSWSKFFPAVHCSTPADLRGWIKQTCERAASKGRMYGGGGSGHSGGGRRGRGGRRA
jgi:ubiquitin-protein ligase